MKFRNVEELLLITWQYFLFIIKNDYKTGFEWEMMLKRRKNHEDREMAAFQDFKVLTSEIISRTAFGFRNLYKIRIPRIR